MSPTRTACSGSRRAGAVVTCRRVTVGRDAQVRYAILDGGTDLGDGRSNRGYSLPAVVGSDGEIDV